jgi:hypothetical protein
MDRFQLVVNLDIQSLGDSDLGVILPQQALAVRLSSALSDAVFR